MKATGLLSLKIDLPKGMLKSRHSETAGYPFFAWRNIGAISADKGRRRVQRAVAFFRAG